MTFITAIKIIGVSSLGLLTGSLVNQAIKTIPDLINNINYVSQNEKESLETDKYINISLGAVSSFLLLLTYAYSTKHPYLLYTSILGPLALGTLSVNFSRFKKLWRKLEIKLEREFEEPIGDKLPVSRSSSIDDLSKSYVNVKSESSTPSPTLSSSSTGFEDIAEEVKSEVDSSSIDLEVDQSLLKKKYLHDLQKLRVASIFGVGISGFGFLIGLIGIVGETVLR